MQIIGNQIVLHLNDVDRLLQQTKDENPHAVWGELRVKEVITFEEPYEDGTNIGEVHLVLNKLGNEAIYGIYTGDTMFQLFAN